MTQADPDHSQQTDSTRGGSAQSLREPGVGKARDTFWLRRMGNKLMTPGWIDSDSGITGAEGANEGVIKSGKLAGLSMTAAIWVLSWPVITESFLNALVGLVDTSLAASLSEAATDAVGAAAYFMWFIGLIGMAIGVGVTAMVSRSMGRGRVAAANAALGQAVLLATVLGAVGGALIYGAAPWIANLLSLGGTEAGALTIGYLRALAFGVPAMSIFMACMSGCRGAGDSLKPLWVMGTVNVVNVVASWLLSGGEFAYSNKADDGSVIVHTILPRLDFLNLGVSGIAWGTVLAWWVGVLTILTIVLRGTHGLKLRLKRLKFHAITATRLARVAIPNFIETYGMWFGNFIIIMFVGWFELTGQLGAHIVAIRVEAFSFMPGFAMSIAASTLAGQYLGAKNPRLAKIAIWRCTVIASAIMGTFGLVFVFTPGLVVGIFTQQQVHLELTPWLLMAAGFTQIPFAVAICVRGALRGAGDAKAVMRLTLIAIYAVRLPLAWVCCGVEIPLDWIPGVAEGAVIPNPAPLQAWWDVHPLIGLWIGMCIEHVIRAVMFLVRFWGGAWTKARV